MIWLLQSVIPPPVETPVLLKGRDGAALEAMFWTFSGGNQWEWLDANGEVVYSYADSLDGTFETIEWAVPPDMLLPMHCAPRGGSYILLFSESILPNPPYVVRWNSDERSARKPRPYWASMWGSDITGDRQRTATAKGWLPATIHASRLKVLEIEVPK